MNPKSFKLFKTIVYKKTDEWYIEWQRVTTSGTTSGNEWEWVTTNGNEWQRMTTLGTTNDNEWQRVTTNDNKWCNEWQRVTTGGIEWRSDKEWQFWPNFFFSNNMGLVWAVLHFITPEVTAGSTNRCIQNLCKFIKVYCCGIS